MTSQSDTEALKALVALAKKATSGPVYTVVNSHDKSVNVAVIEKDYQIGPYIALLKITEACRSREDAAFIEAAYNAIPAIERLLASQGAEPIGWAQGSVPIDYSISWGPSEPHPLGTWTALYTAPPLAEPDVEGAAKEICDWIINDQAMDASVSKLLVKHYVPDIAAIIRKHLRPTQQTERPSAAPQAEGEK